MLRPRHLRIALYASADLATTISTFDDHQVLAGEVGWGAVEPGPDEPPRPLTLEPAMCTHAILSASNGEQPFIVGDANSDWRFRRSVRRSP